MAYEKLFGLINKSTTPVVATATAETQVLTTQGSHEIEVRVLTGVEGLATLPVPSTVPGSDVVPGQIIKVTFTSDAVDATDGVETLFKLTPAGMQEITMADFGDNVVLIATESSYHLLEDNRRCSTSNQPATIMADNSSNDLDLSTGHYVSGGTYTVALAGTNSANIKLPLATINNTGMIIRILCTRDVATDGTCHIGFADSGSTVMQGNVTLVSTTANKIDTAPLSAAKRIELDADDNAHAGGAEGSVYEFFYLGANFVFCNARGVTTGSAPTLDGSEQSTTGIS